MAKIMGLDPGSKESGYVIWNTETHKVEKSAHIPNEIMLTICRLYDKRNTLAIEQIRGYGIVAGDDTFDTCEWSGRFREAHDGGEVVLIPRKDIKRHLCGNTTTNDKYIRQALIDRYGDVGTKKKPGPLFGISGHLWAALAVCVVCEETYDEQIDPKGHLDMVFP